tara:strand:- start:159 stop:830 length:672 start_codon:yes stop_codon:yes gene_type:complete
MKLGLGLSLSSISPQGAWSPDDEASLEAWYQNEVGITLDGSNVSRWSDSSSNSRHMSQLTDTEQPAYSSGTLTFDSGETQNLQATSEISLANEFTIGLKITPTSFSNVVMGSNTSANEFMKITANDKIRIKIDTGTADFTLDSGTFGDDYLVFTRDGSNLITMYKNGVAQADTETKAGTVDIDCLGVRKTDLNAYNGDMEEVQIFSSSSAALTANVNDRLSSI